MIVVSLCFTAAALTTTGVAVEFANTTTTTIIASISMAHPSKRSLQLKEQLKEARRSMKQRLRREDRALQTAIEALGVPAEGDSDRYQLQDSTNESSDKSSEEECEITDEEDTDIFGGK